MLLISTLLALLPALALASPISSNSTSTSESRASGPCSCGYKLSKYNNVYFPNALTVSFDKVTSLSALQAAGFEINTGWGIGPEASDGGRAIGSTKNIGFSNGVMTLTVPGGQKKGGQITGAEINTAQSFGGGVFTMNAQLSAEKGTVQSIFSYSANSDVYGDEQDIELLASNLLEDNPTNGTPKGIELTNYDPKHTGNNDATIVPFPNDPTKSFNDYTIGWVKGGTTYYYNGKALNSPKKYSSVNPSLILLNNWSSGDETFSQGPPAKDSVLKVKSITFYYQARPLDKYPVVPNGCTQAQACVV
ncbi:uncharacterized protein L201_006319 [Kwoniella dendrophila CBS 6074]|uniref:GH16 domain-containing protein n=1 Tax=Kwoniella dendrophila CBS 6074 TaxID=1295534 RepID=A0AAX4K0W9_9TREE